MGLGVGWKVLGIGMEGLGCRLFDGFGGWEVWRIGEVGWMRIGELDV